MKITKIRSVAPGRGRRKRTGILPGLLTALGILLTGITVITLLISGGKLGLAGCKWIGKTVYTGAALTGCFLSSRRAAQGKLLWAGITAALLCAVTLGLIYAQPEPDAGSVGTVLVLSAAAWLTGGLLGARRIRSGYL